jgi:hypothetical protein
LFVQNIKINGCNRSGFKICKSINETLNLWAANAKKRRITCNEPMNPEGLLIVSELINGIWTSAIRYSKK